MCDINQRGGCKLLKARKQSLKKKKDSITAGLDKADSNSEDGGHARPADLR